MIATATRPVARIAVSPWTRDRWAATLEAVTGIHLLFPLAIIVVATAGFAIGQRLDGWVLPAGAAIAIAGTRFFAASWREAGYIAVAAAVVHVAAAAVALAFPDGSWDGLTYHQEAILRLGAGWNPFYGSAATWGPGWLLYLDHYPRGPWITAAAVLVSSGQLEAGKLFNLTLMAAAGAQVLALLLRLTPLAPATAIVIALITALNPVFIAQSTTFYVDGVLGSLLTTIVAGLVVFIATKQWRSLGLVLLATVFVTNVKFTGVAYPAVLLMLAIPLVAWRHGLRVGWQAASAAAIAGIIGVLLVGYVPYVRNLVQQGSPFYPASPSPAHRPDNLILQRPANLAAENRVMRFLISNFSRSEPVRPPQSTRLKFPLSIGPGERRGVYGADMEAGGFGPLFGVLLLLVAGAALALVTQRSTRRIGRIALIVSGAVLVSVFAHTETWWARFVPQAWLLPMVVAAAALCAPRRTSRWWLGCALIAVAAANLLIVGANVGRRQVLYARATDLSLQEMAAASQPVGVYPGPFAPLRQRLREAGIEFELLQAPPASGLARHPIPAPGNQAFWVELR